MSNLIIFGNHVLSSRGRAGGRATVVGNARARARTRFCGLADHRRKFFYINAVVAVG